MMTSTVTRIPKGDQMVTIETTVTSGPLCIEWKDIEATVECDEWHNEAPWDSCDGYEHEFVDCSYYDHDDAGYSYKYVSRPRRNGGAGFIEIDEESICKMWGSGYPGCSKQVRAETIARHKRIATEQLVKWYSDGWEWFQAGATYGDYSDGCGGIDSFDYAQEVAEECRHNVAAQLDGDGYLVLDAPDPPKPYNAVDAFRDRIRRNLDCS